MCFTKTIIGGSLGIGMNFTVFMTNMCNLNCNYCYEKNKKNRSISYEVLNAFIEMVANYDGEISIVIHGGEPLLEFEKIKYLINKINTRKKNGAVTYSLTTNGTLLNGEVAEFLKDKIDSLAISIDGNKELHDLNRIDKKNEGTYDTVIENINNYFPNDKNRINARMTINTLNYTGVDKSIIHLINMGFGRISPVVDQFDLWSKNQWDELLEKLQKVKRYIEKENIKAEIGLIYDAKYKCKNSVCNGGITTIVVDSDGALYPCIVVNGKSEYCIGDVFNGVNIDRVRKIHEHDRSKVESCVGCSRYDYCEATRCKLINKYQTGKWNQPNINICKIHNIKISLATSEK
ncbi:MAG: radical SAM protein [Pseudobutyrivibrio sp.]|nr:radical SAM protein [Pseudobutyrivibrio sp.]